MARVLVVEDDPDTAYLLATRLRSYGHIVVTSPSGALALRQVGFDFPLDIAVLDINLNGMSGFDLLTELRRHVEIENPELPAVFLSGDREPETVERARNMGATFLPKPFVSGELQGAILVALNGLPDVGDV